MTDRAQRGTGPASSSGRKPNFLIGLARRFFAESLFKNSAFLLVNLGVGALSGFGSLALLTHVFSKQDVGLSATAISGAALIETITLLGVTYSVPRYLPTAKNRTAMINTLLTAVILLTVVASGIFLALPYARKFAGLGGWLFIPVFIVTVCIQAGTTVLSSVLVADRASDKLVVFGLIPSGIRVVAPPVLSFLGGLGSYVARVIPDSFGFAMYATVLVRRGHRFRPALDIGVAREMARFSIGMYVANIIGGLPQMLLPLIALARIGATQSAYWSVAMSMSAILYSLPSMVTSALLPEVSLRPDERPQLLRRAALLIAAVVTPALIVAFFAAPIALAAFGQGYTAGTLPVFRWLVAAGFITMLNAVTGAILFIAKKSTLITIVNVIDAVIVLGLVAVWATNAADVAICWMIGDIGNTVLFAGCACYALREVGGRWDKLGGESASAASATGQVPANRTTLGHVLLATMADQQRGVEGYRAYSAPLTSTHGLFSVSALQAAEQRWLQANQETRAQPVASGRPAEPPDPPDRTLDLLFSMAERQRTAHEDEERYPRYGRGPHP